MSVRGPRVPRMVLKEDRPAQRRAVFIAALLVLALVALASWLGGRWAVLSDLSAHGGSVMRLVEADTLVRENRALREELAVYREGGDVARQIEERVRVDNRQLQDRVAELEQALAYYRRAAVPDRSGKGLRIERLEVLSSGRPQAWTLSLLLLRTGETDGTFEGRLEGRVVADSPTGRVELPLADVLGPAKQEFRVRYAQDMKVDLHLPAGLTPVRVDLVAVVTAPRADRIEKSWPARQAPRPQEVPANAGQG